MIGANQNNGRKSYLTVIADGHAYVSVRISCFLKPPKNLFPFQKEKTFSCSFILYIRYFAFILDQGKYLADNYSFYYTVSRL